jgi:ketosteroid isomerase-like protein
MTKAPPSLACAALAGAAMLLAGCGGLGAHHHVITAKVIDTIKAGEVRWNEDYKSGDPAKILAHFAADAIVMTPGASPVVGAQALRESVVASLEEPHFHLAFTSDEVDVPRSGEWAAVRGAYSREGDATGKDANASASGTYVALYKPAGDGRWLVAWLMLEPGPPSPPPPTPTPAPPDKTP